MALLPERVQNSCRGFSGAEDAGHEQGSDMVRNCGIKINADSDSSSSEEEKLSLERIFHPAGPKRSCDRCG